MGTIGARGLQRKSLSSQRAQRTIEAIEAQLGIKVSGDTSDNPTSQKIPSEPKLGDNNEGSLD